MPQYEVEDWVTFLGFEDRKSEPCSKCGREIYDEPVRKEVSGKIVTIFTTTTSKTKQVAYTIRVDLETEVVLVYVTEDKILGKLGRRKRK